MEIEPGLRERKKLRTRQLIAETARRMFAERGFDAVPVAAVARAAEVSEATVFNYFPTTATLAALIAEDTAAGPDDLRPQVVAHALIGAHQSLIEFVRRRLLDGATVHARLAQEVTTQGRRAFDLLEQGLVSYGAKPAADPGKAADPRRRARR